MCINVSHRFQLLASRELGPSLVPRSRSQLQGTSIKPFAEIWNRKLLRDSGEQVDATICWSTTFTPGPLATFHVWNELQTLSILITCSGLHLAKSVKAAARVPSLSWLARAMILHLLFKGRVSHCLMEPSCGRVRNVYLNKLYVCVYICTYVYIYIYVNVFIYIIYIYMYMNDTHRLICKCICIYSQTDLSVGDLTVLLTGFECAAAPLTAAGQHLCLWKCV